MNSPPQGSVSHREILTLALPALGTLAAEPLMGLLDTAFLGRVGSIELAALGAANALLALLAASLIFLEYGTTARLARRFGAGETESLAREAVQMGWIATLLGVALTAVFFFGSRGLMELLDPPPKVVEAGALYLGIRAAGSIPGLWMRTANGVFRGLQDTRTPLGIVVGMNLLNAVLDVLLIFGWPALGVPAFGIAGAAWATVIATWSGAVVFLAILARRLEFPRRGRRRFLAIEWGMLRRMLGVSGDLLLRSIGLQAALFAGTRMAAVYGTAALAAHQVGWQLWSFLALVLDSLAIAGQALVGRTLGAGRPDLARAAGGAIQRQAFWLGVFFCALFLVLRTSLPRLFTDQPDVLAALDTIFGILAVMQIPNAILFAFDGLLIGASDMGFLRNAMLALGIFGVGAVWAGSVWGGSLRGVWLGIAVFMAARLLVMGWRWRSGAWIR